MCVEVREARLGDAPSIRDVHVASIEGLAGDEYSEKQVAAWAHDRDPADYPIVSDDTYFVVAERSAQVVGFGYMKPDADEYFETRVDGEITAVYVHPAVARRGVGTDIYTTLEAEAHRHDVESLGLWASLNAVSFYEAQGYQRETAHTLEYTADVELDVIEMRKRLSG